MRIISGIQPTGSIHIGGYLGAIKQWVELQKENECIFFVANLHALTVPQDPKRFNKETLNTAIELLALGLDPENCIIFVQSQVPYHTELTWIFNTITPLGELKRMTQFKEKAKRFEKNVNAGLLTYPVLQAADILLYQPDAVPVGKDQIQHLELTRTIAKKFNRLYGETFKIPKPLVQNIGSKIMALNDPKKKMSKSDEKTSLSLFAPPKVIKEKIMKAVTDPGKEIKYDPSKKPGISNLLTIYSLFSDLPIKEIEKKFQGKGYASFKEDLIRLLIEKLTPFRKRKEKLLSREIYVKEILKKGAEKAKKIAQSTILQVRQKVGLFT